MPKLSTGLSTILSTGLSTSLVGEESGPWRDSIASGVLDLYYGNDGVGSGQEVLVTGELDQWDDSINGYSFTAPAAGARPDDSSDSYLFTSTNSERLDNQTAAFLTRFGDNKAWSISFRMTQVASPAVGAVWSWSQGATTRCQVRMGSGGTSPSVIMRHGSTTDVTLTAVATFSAGETFTVTVTYDGAGTLTLFVDGTQEDQATGIDGTALDGDATVFTVGANSGFGVPASATPLDGELHELIVAETAWDTSQRGQVEAGLSSAWP